MQPRESADWKKHTMLSPPTRTQFSLRPVNARVKAGLGGKEGAPLPLLLWKWQGCSWRLSSRCLGSLPSPIEFQKSLRLGCRKGPGRDGAGGRGGGQGCAITVLLEGEQSANPHLLLISSCHRLLLLSISSHISILTQKKFRPFFLFFKVQKALCCPRERIFGQAVQCKEKGGS